MNNLKAFFSHKDKILSSSNNKIISIKDIETMIQLKQITLDNTNKSIIKEFDTTQALYNEIISAESELINEEIIDEVYLILSEINHRFKSTSLISTISHKEDINNQNEYSRRTTNFSLSNMILLVFAYLEKILLEKNKNILKCIIVDYYSLIETLDQLYGSSLNIFKLENQEKINFNLNITLLSFMLKLIKESNTEEDTNNSYILFYKLFNFCSSFSIGMTVYFIHKISEFIAKNQDLTVNNDLKLENILNCSSINNMFSEISSNEISLVSVIPIFSILFNSDIKVNNENVECMLSLSVPKVQLSFTYDENSKAENSLKYQYSLSFYEKYQYVFNIFVEDKDKKNNGNIESAENKDNTELLSIHEFVKESKEIEIENNLTEGICVNCEKLQEKTNITNYCLSCLDNLFTSELLSKYISFIQLSHHMYDSENEDEIELKYISMIKEGSCVTKTGLKINFDILENLLTRSIDDTIKTFKCKFCVECTLSINEIMKQSFTDKLFIPLPCRCVLCSRFCCHKFLKRVLTNEFNKCLCGENYSIKDLIELLKTLESYELQKEIDSIKSFLIFKFKSTCFLCLSSFDMYSDIKIHRVTLEEKDEKLFNKKNINHIVCDECYQDNKKEIKGKKIIKCLMCDIDHKITKLSKNINFNDEDDSCVIY